MRFTFARRPLIRIAALGLVSSLASGQPAVNYIGHDLVTGRTIPYRVLPDGSALAYGDVRIGTHAQILQEGGIRPIGIARVPAGSRGKRAVPEPLAQRWTRNTVYFGFAAGVREQTRSAMAGAMAALEQSTTVRFIEDIKQPFYVLIKSVEPEYERDAQGKVTGTVCGSSYVGMLKQYAQPQTLTLGCDDIPTAIHELMHALGFKHEEQGGPDDVKDPLSIMHAYTETTATLSAMDVAAINQLYPAITPGSGQEQPASPPGAAPMTAEDGKPGPAYRQLRARQGDTCLTALGDPRDQALAREGSVGMRTCRSGAATQGWVLLGSGRLMNKAYPGSCLEKVKRRGHAVLGLCSNVSDQLWKMAGNHVVSRTEPNLVLVRGSGTVSLEDRARTPQEHSDWRWQELTAPTPVPAPDKPSVPSPLPAPAVPLASGEGDGGNAGRTYRQLRALHSSACLTALGDPRRQGMARESLVGMRTCRNNDARQKWVLLGSGRLVNQSYAGTCLDMVEERSMGGGRGKAVLRVCSNRLPQRWEMVGNQLVSRQDAGWVLQPVRGNGILKVTIRRRIPEQSGWTWQN